MNNLMIFSSSLLIIILLWFGSSIVQAGLAEGTDPVEGTIYNEILSGFSSPCTAMLSKPDGPICSGNRRLSHPIIEEGEMTTVVSSHIYKNS
ncbi:hypothetical protein CPB83DRAFT_589544 [Crepidotus variabilis]|uniref:Uncharacterized protein n=1 Tax=Crepidotus variabilis TaxID=179855 RepID=A0A9P6JTC2_9AGAR|nr:hypothetical protein CPB83DRAFT_589544 [Crepidotus variabilis]